MQHNTGASVIVNQALWLFLMSHESTSSDTLVAIVTTHDPVIDKYMCMV